MLPPPLRFRVRAGDRLIGPHSLETLQQMASLREFDESVSIALDSSENWIQLREAPELHTALFPPTRQFQLKDKPFETINHSAATPVPTIEEMLKDNLSRQQKLEGPVNFDDIPPQRRHRDFAIAEIFGAALTAAMYILLPHNPVVLVFGLSFFVLYSVSVYWIFYHIMDRY